MHYRVEDRQVYKNKIDRLSINCDFEYLDYIKYKYIQKCNRLEVMVRLFLWCWLVGWSEEKQTIFNANTKRTRKHCLDITIVKHLMFESIKHTWTFGFLPSLTYVFVHIYDHRIPSTYPPLDYKYTFNNKVVIIICYS